VKVFDRRPDSNIWFCVKVFDRRPDSNIWFARR